jgi:hypothetical protein
MRAISHATRRTAIAVSSLSAFGIAVMAAAAPAAATPAGQQARVPAFSSCAAGQPARTPLVVVNTRAWQRADTVLTARCP